MAVSIVSAVELLTDLRSSVFLSELPREDELGGTVGAGGDSRLSDLWSFLTAYHALSHKIRSPNSDAPFCVEITDPSIWSGVEQALRLLLRRDDAQFRFTRAEAPPSAIPCLFSIFDFDSIVIFRPSLASVSGTLSLLKHGHTPLLILDRPLQADLDAPMQKLLDFIASRYSGFACVGVRHSMWQVPPNRFLPFVSLLAGWFAGQVGASQVLVFEEILEFIGVLRPAFCVPEGDSLATVIAHANLVFAELGMQQIIQNPYACCTQSEIAHWTVSETLDTQEIRELLNASMEGCCGICARCLHECVSLLALGVLDVQTEHPAASSHGLPAEQRHHVVQLLMALDDLITLPLTQLWASFPEISSAVPLPFEDALDLVRKCAMTFKSGILGDCFGRDALVDYRSQ